MEEAQLRYLEARDHAARLHPAQISGTKSKLIDIIATSPRLGQEKFSTSILSSEGLSDHLALVGEFFWPAE